MGEAQAPFGIGPAAGRIARHKATFAGFLKCAECGCRITYDPKRKGELACAGTGCANGRLQHRKLVYVRQEAILDGFRSAVESIEIDDVLARQVTTILNETQEAVRATRKRDAAQFAGAASASSKGREDELYEHLRSGVLDEGKATSGRSGASARSARISRAGSLRPTKAWTPYVR